MTAPVMERKLEEAERTIDRIWFWNELPIVGPVVTSRLADKLDRLTDEIEAEHKATVEYPLEAIRPKPKALPKPDPELSRLLAERILELAPQQAKQLQVGERVTIDGHGDFEVAWLTTTQAGVVARRPMPSGLQNYGNGINNMYASMGLQQSGAAQSLLSNMMAQTSFIGNLYGQ